MQLRSMALLQGTIHGFALQDLFALFQNKFHTIHSLESHDVPFASPEWFLYGAISALLVAFGGIMSGLTLGLLSLSPVDLDVLIESGTADEKQQAAAILPAVHRQHELLVTLLLCNAVAMEALPIFLDRMVHPALAIALSVTFVLLFGEVIPQAVCSRFGLSVGASLIWLVRFLMLICWPISFPLGKTLDLLLGHDSPLYRRQQLRALVGFHAEEAGRGGELSRDETTIIRGALDLMDKTAEEAMTPIGSTFSVSITSKLDWDTMRTILNRGYSRVPVYRGHPSNIIGVLLAKGLVTVRPEDDTPISAMSIRRVPRMPADMPLYEALNLFQLGHSHLAVVVRSKNAPEKEEKESAQGVAENGQQMAASVATSSSERQGDEHRVQVAESDIEIKYAVKERPRKAGMSEGNEKRTKAAAREDGWRWEANNSEEEEAIGILTLEDVIEELLQEEIVDETDEYIDVHKRIRVSNTRKAPFSALPRRAQSYDGRQRSLSVHNGNSLAAPLLEEEK